MNRLCFTMIPFAALFLVGSHALGEADKEAPRVKLEIRLAQKESAEGLEEMVGPQTKEKIYVHKGAVFSNADVAAARAVKSEINNQPTIEIVFKETSRKKVGEFSEKNIGKIAAIFIDGNCSLRR